MSAIGRARHSTAAALVAALTAVVVSSSPASGSTEGVGTSAARCASGAVAAVIAGKRVCLRRGQRCKKRLDRQYHRYGFHCHNGRLTGGPTPPQPLPSAGAVVATIPTPHWGGIAVGAGAVWVANLISHTVTRIDPEQNRVVATIPVGEGALDVFHGPTFLGFGHGTVWVLDGTADCGCVHRIDPSTNRIVATIGLGTPTQLRVAPLGIAVQQDAVWVALRWGTEGAPTGSVVRIDPTTNEVVAVVPVGSNPEGGGPTGIAATASAVWVGVPSTRSVVRIDPATNSVVATTPGLTCAEGQITADESEVWVADCGVVRRIDARTNTITSTIPIKAATGAATLGIARGLGSVWAQAGPLVRIDPARAAIVGVSPLDPALVWGEYSIAIGFGSIWVRQIDSVVRIQPK